MYSTSAVLDLVNITPVGTLTASHTYSAVPVPHALPYLKLCIARLSDLGWNYWTVIVARSLRDVGAEYQTTEG